MKTLEALFLDELADIYDAENRLTKALPKLAKSATHEELRAALESHLDETKEHVKKLEKVFRMFNKPARGKKCEAIVGLLKEGDEIASDNKNSPTINAALVSAAQKVEHYEIASYGCLREWAEELGQAQAAEVLQEILDEEKAADQKLTDVARSRCNESANNGPSEEDETPGRRRATRGSARTQRSQVSARG
jgi:ferritin-like metal-binding protein YciE